MTKHLGDFDQSAVIYSKFATFRPSTGAAFTLGGTPALSVYKDNSTTQSTTGVTLTADFDGVTGLNHLAIDTSADGTFYSTGSFFDVVVTTGTVDSVSVVGAVVASFTIRKNSSLKPTTAGRTLVVDASGLADANAVKVGPTGVGTSQTARDIYPKISQLTYTITNQADVNVIDWKGATAPAMTGDAFARLGAPAGASVSADIAVIKSDTGTILTDVNTGAGAIYTRIGAPAGASIAADVAAVKTDTAAVKVKTDQFVFTVANQVDANTLSMVATLRAGIRKNIALAAFEFLMTDSTTHNPVTGKTVSVTRSIDGGAFGAGTLSAVTEIGVGIYSVDFGSSDLNGNVITLRATAASCDDTFVTIKTSP